MRILYSPYDIYEIILNPFLILGDSQNITVGFDGVDWRDRAVRETLALLEFANKYLKPPKIEYPVSLNAVFKICDKYFKCIGSRGTGSVMLLSDLQDENNTVELSISVLRMFHCVQNPNVVKVQQKYKKSGNIYTVRSIANENTTRYDEYPIMVNYCGANGFLWSTTLDNWLRKAELIL